MKRGFNNRAQFFILAAVILSAIIISIATISNRARVSREPENFYDSTYEIKRESNAVLDWEIYSGFSDDKNLTDFVDKIALDYRDKDPDLNFVVIYGNLSKVEIRNYGEKSVREGSSEEVEGGGKSTRSIVGIDGGVQTETSIETSNYGEVYWTQSISDLQEGDSIDIGIRSQNFSFPINQYKQVIFVKEKEVNNESFVDVK